MLKIEEIRIGDKKAVGLSLKIPNSDHADLLIMICDKGYAMCGYLNMDTAQRLDDTAIVLNSRELGGMQDIEVSQATRKALELGIKIGMKGSEALKLLMD